MLATRLADRVPQGNMTPADLVNIMGDAATVDLRGEEVLPDVLHAVGSPTGLKNDVSLLKQWVSSGAHRVDRNGDGQYDDQAAVALMDAWWPRLIHAIFDRRLDGLYHAIPVPFDDTGRTDHSGSSFLDGYYGYVQTAVRMALGEPVARSYRALRCANGTAKGCRKALRASLRDTVQALGSNPSNWNAHEAGDEIHFSAVGIVEVDPILWQNRPTFQQVVQVTSHR
jgi:hypothetical protein